MSAQRTEYEQVCWCEADADRLYVRGSCPIHGADVYKINDRAEAVTAATFAVGLVLFFSFGWWIGWFS